jgi:hypothetical protein
MEPENQKPNIEKLLQNGKEFDIKPPEKGKNLRLNFWTTKNRLKGINFKDKNVKKKLRNHN